MTAWDTDVVGLGQGFCDCNLAEGNVALGGLWSLTDGVVRFWNRTLIDMPKILCPDRMMSEDDDSQLPSDFSCRDLSVVVYEVIFSNQVWIVFFVEDMCMATKGMAGVCEYTEHFLGLLATRR